MVSKLFKVIISIAFIGIIFTGCSSNKEASETVKNVSETESTSKSKDVKKIIVATEATYKPYSYSDESGKLTGYDVEVIRELDKLIDDVEFDIVTAPWDSIFLGVDSNKYQVAINNLTKKPEREEKYLLTNNPYFVNKTVLAVKEGRDDIKSVEDLKGKKVPVVSGTAPHLYFEKFNKENKDNPIKLINVEADATATLQGISTGKYDASVYELVLVDEIKANFNLKVKTVEVANEQEIQESDAYIFFRKDQVDLKEKVDKALEKLKANGTLSKLSVEFFKADYSK